MSEKDLKQIKVFFEKADLLTEKAERDIALMEGFVQSFKEINHNITELERMYFGEDWVPNLQKLRAAIPDEQYNSTGEDTIWNLSVGYHALLLKLLKLISDRLNEANTKI